MDENTPSPPAQTGGVFVRVHLSSILTLALTLRLAVGALVIATNAPGWFFHTPGELKFLAQSLLAGNGFSSPWGGSTGPTAFLAPGYPAIIASIFYLFGNCTPAAAIVVLLLQTLFGVLTVFLIVRITREVFDATAANIAGYFWAIGIPFIWMPVVFWDTSLSILLLTAAIALALHCKRNPTTKSWAWMGLFGGLTLLVNPSFALTLLALFAWTIYQTRPVSLTRPLISVVLLLTIFAPWPIRNAYKLHAFIPLRSNIGFELWKGNRPGATAVDDEAIYPVFNRAEFNDYAAKGEVAYMREKSALAKQSIAAHPSTFLGLSTERFLRYWTGTGTNAPTPILAAHEILTTLLGLFGLASLLRNRRDSLALLFFLPLLLFPLPYYITHAELRFRILVEPVTTMLSAYAVTRVIAWLAQRNHTKLPTPHTRRIEAI